jgi:D-alanine transaminase
MVEGGEIITRPLSHHLLGSVTRAWVKRLALQQAVTWREEPMSLARLLAADEVWLLASSKQITPVICVDQQAIGAGVPGPLWRKMIDAYRAALCPL